MLNILITGGTGHIGSYLIRNLGKNFNDLKIIILDNMSTNRYCSLFNLPNFSQYQFTECDLVKCQITDIPKADIVIHLAAKTDAAKDLKFKEEFNTNNYESTKKIIEYSIKNNVKLIFASSTSVYGPQSNFVDENCEIKDLNPQSPYAKVKLDEENLIAKSFYNLSEKYLILRLGTIYGFSPGIRFHTAVNKFCLQASMGVPLTVWNTAYNQKRPYLGLHDLNNAISHIIKSNLINNEIYNILSYNLKVRDIIEILKIKLDVSINYVEHEIMNQLSYKVSNQKFTDTNFKFSSNIQKEIFETLDNIKNIR